MDGIGDFAGGCGIDGGAVDEKSFGRYLGKSRLEDVAKDVFDMGRFWQNGDDRFLVGKVSIRAAGEHLVAVGGEKMIVQRIGFNV